MSTDGKYIVWDEYGPAYQIPAAGGTIGTFSPAPTYSSFSPAPGPVLANGTVAFVSASGAFPGVYTAAEGQTSANAESSISMGTYGQVGFIALNPAASTAYLLSALSASPWTNYLLQCPLNGQTCTTLGAAIGSYTTSTGIAGGGLIVNGNYAFWSDSSPASLKRYAFAGGAISTFTNAVQAGPALDTSNVYWVGTPIYTIYSLPQSFSTTSVPANLGNSSNPINGLASDGTNVYYAAYDLYYVPVGGGASTLMFTSSASLPSERYVVVVGGVVYWVDEDLGACPETSNIMAIATP